MNYMVKIYKILTNGLLFLILGTFGTSALGQQVTFRIKSLGSGAPVANAVIDLQSCHIGKFFSDENGVVRFHARKADTCVLYISASGYISLTLPFHLLEGGKDFEKTFYMQRQEQYKMGRILAANSFIPIQGVEISRIRKDGTEQLIGVSDWRGVFGVVNYYSGEYHLVFRHPDYITQEKIVFLRRDDGELGSFFMEGTRNTPITVEEKNPKLTGITSKKFSFLGSHEKYIIVLGLYKGRENLPTITGNSEIQFVEKGDWIRMFIGPYDSERLALARLEEVREKYPQAILKSE